MTTLEVGQALVDLCREGKFMEAITTLYAQDIVSVEAFAPPGESREASGLDAIIGKANWWADNHEIHSSSVEGPLASAAHFCVRFTIDVTFKPTGRRHTMDELGIYQVKDGKVIREEFFYTVG
jgi:hypothetical protein